jgi:hypothetical protein
MQDNKPKFVAYLRVWTDRQGKSGLGLEAQRAAVHQLVAQRDGEIIAPEHRDIESGKLSNRRELEKAMKRCRLVPRCWSPSWNVSPATPPSSSPSSTAVTGTARTRDNLQAYQAALEAAKARGTKLGGIRAGATDISNTPWAMPQADGNLTHGKWWEAGRHLP